MKVRELTAAEVEFTLEIEEDGVPEEGDFDSGEPEKDAELRKELRERLANGDLWAWCTVKVTAKWRDWKGTDYLGKCSYANEADFKEPGGYWDDMKNSALEDLNKGIAKVAKELEDLVEKGVDVKPLVEAFERTMGGG